MKRILVAVSFAALAAPAFAVEVGAPFEQTQFDRGLQDNGGASSGSTRVESGVWTQDYNFIAPAQ
jgi:hypothetical protein